MYCDVTSRRVRASIVAVKIAIKYYIFRMCVCSLRHLTCKAHAPYCHLWPARLYNIFPHYLINGTIFGGEGGGLKIKMRFDFLYKFV